MVLPEKETEFTKNNPNTLTVFQQQQQQQQQRLKIISYKSDKATSDQPQSQVPSKEPNRAWSEV